MKKFVCLGVAAGVAAATLCGAEVERKLIYSCEFKKDAWNQNDWMIVRSPRWLDVSHWVQNEDSIANYVPADIRPEDMQMGRDRTGETYISMLLKQAITGSAKITLECAFDSRMAPLIVFSKTLEPVTRNTLKSCCTIVASICGTTFTKMANPRGNLSDISIYNSSRAKNTL